MQGEVRFYKESGWYIVVDVVVCSKRSPTKKAAQEYLDRVLKGLSRCEACRHREFEQ